MQKIVILGAGNFSKLVLDICLMQNKFQFKYKVLGFIDEDTSKFGQDLLGYKVLGDFSWFDTKNITEIKVICSIANTKDKKKFVDKANSLGLQFFNAIHPSSIVSDFAKLGKGIIINAGTIIAADAIIKDHVIVNFDCTIGHDVVLEDYVSVMPSANLAGNVIAREGAYIGMKSAIIQNVIIGKYSTIGAGSVVTKRIGDYVTAVGVPAKEIKVNEKY